MNPRSNQWLAAILAVMLVASWGNAQDHTYGVSRFPVPLGEMRGQHVRLAGFESALDPGDSREALGVRAHYPLKSPPLPSDIGVIQPSPESNQGGTTIGDTGRPASDFSGNFSNIPSRSSIGVDLYAPPEFDSGLIIFGRDVAMKIGGYVKADFIYDFDPIDETDSFVTTSIPVGAAPRTNARYHARQSRLSFDTRWATDERTVRIFLESDFFGTDNYFRLRHAYGEVGPLLVGRTWTTFTDVSASPATLDFEGSVSAVNRRQPQARWTQRLFHEDVTMSLAVEDTKFIIEPPQGVTGEARTPSPDFVGNVRLKREWGRFHVGGLYRIVGFQPTGYDVVTSSAWGLNFTGVVLISQNMQAYYQIVAGEGIGSYRSLPDAAPNANEAGKLLPLFGWMVGVTRNWTDRLSSNFTYAENSLDNTTFQKPDDVHRTTYLAANMIWNPMERVRVGVEYLYGLRENVDRGVGSANRVQMSFIFDLP